MSESDEPFEVVQLEKPAGAFGATEACLVVNRPSDSRVQEQRLDDFFGELTHDHDWHGKPNRRRPPLPRPLAVIPDRLADATVFRLGDVQVDIIIVGRASDGRWVGVKTRAVET